MNVYICYRYDDPFDRWMGASIVAADSEQDAGRLMVDYEEDTNCYETPEEYRESYSWPKRIVMLADVTATGEPRVLYEDYER